MATVELHTLDERTTALSAVAARSAWAGELGRSAFPVEFGSRSPWVLEIDARWTFLEAVLALSVSTVSIATGEVGDINTTTLDLTWSAPISSLSSTYTFGLTITVNGSPASILSAVLQPGSQVVRVTLAAAVGVSDTVAAAYSGGDLVDGSGLPVASTTSAVVNNVGTHLYLDQEDDAIHWVTSL